jgi:hypothetical protein
MQSLACCIRRPDLPGRAIRTIVPL